MEFEFTKEQQDFRQEVRDFFRKVPWLEIRRGNKPFDLPSFYKEVTERGWTGLLAPREYGGQGKDAIYETIFAEEISYSEAPPDVILYFSMIEYCTNLVLRCATENQKKEYLPRVIRGELRATQMYTEPDSGSDLASVKTSAVRKGDYYVINGQKMFTSNIESPYSILMARTDPHAPPEKGVSLFILDNNAPGISYTFLENICEIETTQVFLEDVKIHQENLIGEENKGWDYFWRTKDCYWHKARVWTYVNWQKIFDAIVQYVKKTRADGRLLSQNPAVRQKIAEMMIDLKALRLLIYRLSFMRSTGLDTLGFAAILKIIGDGAFLRLANNAMQILGLFGQLGGGTSHAPLSGMMEAMYRAAAIYHYVDSGGAVKAKDFLAAYGLGLPELSRGDA
jgi:alkylation response protein AidB-like acyl-CoA dehydrogenase